MSLTVAYCVCAVSALNCVVCCPENLKEVCEKSCMLTTHVNINLCTVNSIEKIYIRGLIHKSWQLFFFYRKCANTGNIIYTFESV
jgi:hypothetical protein